MRILLDTCTFLWIAAGAAELSVWAREAFEAPDNEVYLSSVSAWEITVKHALGRLHVHVPSSSFRGSALSPEERDVDRAAGAAGEAARPPAGGVESNRPEAAPRGGCRDGRRRVASQESRRERSDEDRDGHARGR